jgi:hypothetical protein
VAEAVLIIIQTIESKGNLGMKDLPERIDSRQIPDDDMNFYDQLFGNRSYLPLAIHSQP